MVWTNNCGLPQIVHLCDVITLANHYHYHLTDEWAR